MPTPEAWQIWARRPEVEGTLVLRARGELPEMEATKQLVRLIGNVYEPGMTILDAGCNTGHYLRGIRRLDRKAEYKGVDAYPFYIEQARSIFSSDPHASFEVKDIMQPLFPDEPYDIVFCCNVILHLPFFKAPVRNLIESTRQHLFIRTLLGDVTTIVKRVEDDDFEESGAPKNYIYQNTYSTAFFADYIRQFNCEVDIIDDDVEPTVINQEHDSVKQGRGTRIVGGQQVDGNIIFGWKFVKVTKR